MQLQDVFPADFYSGKTVFITGGGSGIGLGIAKSFASLGANISICGRSHERLSKAQEEIEQLGVKVFIKSADVRDFVAMVDAAEETKENLGKIDVLICAAAGNFPVPANEMSANGFKAVIDIDLLGTFNSAKVCFEQLAQTRGSVISISAGQAQIPYAAQAHVGAAKAGIENLMRNLALEWGPLGIRCNCILPGPIENTEGFDRLLPKSGRENMKKAIPIRRFGTVEDIGNAAVFLASPLASYITGTTLSVDGGQNLPGSGLFSQIVLAEMVKSAKNRKKS